MVNIEPNSIAVGTIFPFPEAVNPSDLQDFLRESGYEVNEDFIQTINLPSEGIQYSSPSTFAQNDDGIRVLLNPNADLDGFNDSSFITFKVGDQENFNNLFDEVDNLWKNFSKINIVEETELVELTYEGRIRLEDNRYSLTNILDHSKLDVLDESFGFGSESSAVRIDSDKSNDEAGWYRLLIDSAQVKNPHLWVYKINYRVNSYEDYDIEELDRVIKEFVEQTTNG